MDRLGKPLSLRSVDVYVDSGKENIDSVYIIDMLKPVVDHVKPRVFSKVFGFYVEVLHRPQPVCD